jgi:hypothetical protein
MVDAKNIAAQLGQRKIAVALDLGATAVNNALKRGKFPAAWYPIVREMCKAQGLKCPEDAFGFKHPAADHSVCPPSCNHEVRQELPE